MNPESENFDSLRRLLSLKRHEEPPPGYFDRFSRDVMARIKAGESGGTFGLESSWFQRLSGMFDVKPVFAGAFGVAVCALVIAGVTTSEPVTNTVTGQTPSNPPEVAATFAPGDTNSGALTASSLFDQFAPPQMHAVAERYWVPAGKN